MITNQCPNCKYLIGTNKHLVCEAFTNGIPEKILTGEHDHTEPYEGDGGILFQKIQEDE